MITAKEAYEQSKVNEDKASENSVEKYKDFLEGTFFKAVDAAIKEGKYQVKGEDVWKLPSPIYESITGSEMEALKQYILSLGFELWSSRFNNKAYGHPMSEESKLECYDLIRSNYTWGKS